MVSAVRHVRMVYSDTDTPYIINNATYGSFQTYRANSIHDVNYASGTRTMVGQREWAQFYSRYRVEGCKITATFNNQANNGDLLCFIHFARNTDTPWGSWVEAISTVSGNYGGITAVLGPSNGNRGVIRLKKYVSLAKLWGLPAEYKSSGNFTAGMGENPAQSMLARVGILSVTGVSFNATVTLRVKVTMYVRLYNKKILYQTLFAEKENDEDIMEGDDTVNDPDP